MLIPLDTNFEYVSNIHELGNNDFHKSIIKLDFLQPCSFTKILNFYINL